MQLTATRKPTGSYRSWPMTTRPTAPTTAWTTTPRSISHGLESGQYNDYYEARISGLAPPPAGTNHSMLK